MLEKYKWTCIRVPSWLRIITVMLCSAWAVPTLHLFDCCFALFRDSRTVDVGCIVINIEKVFWAFVFNVQIVLLAIPSQSCKVGIMTFSYEESIHYLADYSLLVHIIWRVWKFDSINLRAWKLVDIRRQFKLFTIVSFVHAFGFDSIAGIKRIFWKVSNQYFPAKEVAP